MLLTIDTSSKACSCAVFDNDRLISENYLETGLTHSKTLLSLIKSCLSDSGTDNSSIDKIGVSIGPGSYTGLRIGIATAKGMAFENDIPCYPVSTLLSLAYNLSSIDGFVCSVLDARVGQIFTALFKCENGIVERITPDLAIAIEDFKDRIPNGCFLTGDGAKMLKDKLPEKHLRLAPPTLLFQRASSVGLAILNDEIEKCSGDHLIPQYLRLSQAEREKKEREEVAK